MSMINKIFCLLVCLALPAVLPCSALATSTGIKVTGEITGWTSTAPAAASFGAVVKSVSSGCTDATTCSVTLTSGIGAGDLVLFAVSTINPVAPASVNVGGTYAPVLVDMPQTNTGRPYNSGGVIVSATATSGPVVMTFSATSGGAEVFIYDYPVQNGTPSLDAIISYMQATAGGSPYTVPNAMTLSGSDDVVLQWGTISNGGTKALTSIASPYTDTSFGVDETGMGAADLVSVTSAPAPVWASTGGITQISTCGMAFGFGTSVCQNAAIQDFSSGTNNTVVTAALLNSGGYGVIGGGSGAGAGAAAQFALDGTPGTTSNSQFYTTLPISSCPSLGLPPTQNAPARFCASGQTYPNNSTLVLDYPTAAGNTNSGNSVACKLLLPNNDTNTMGVGPRVIATEWFATDMPQHYSSGGWNVNGFMDAFAIHATQGTGSDYINWQISDNNGSSLQVCLESYTTNQTEQAEYCVTLAPCTWYQLALDFHDGAGNNVNHAEVLDINGNVLGSYTETTLSTSSYNPSVLNFGGMHSNSIVPVTGYNWLVSGVKICYAGTCPSFPWNE